MRFPCGCIVNHDELNDSRRVLLSCWGGTDEGHSAAHPAGVRVRMATIRGQWGAVDAAQ